MENREKGWRFHYSTVGAEDPDCAVVGTAPLKPSGGPVKDCGGISGEPCQERKAAGFSGTGREGGEVCFL